MPTLTKIKQKSANAKTGPLTAVSRSQDSCPTSCALMNNGCYAESGPGGGIFSMVSRYGTEMTTDEMVDAITDTKDEGVRWSVSGDLLTEDGTLDYDYINAIERVHTERPDLFGIIYTHAINEPNPISAIPVNASCDTEDDVITAIANGYVPTMVTPHDEDAPKMVAGRRAVVCPAETKRGDVTCLTCKLCAKGDDSFRDGRPVILFPTHGTRKRAAAEAARERLEGLFSQGARA